MRQRQPHVKRHQSGLGAGAQQRQGQNGRADDRGTLGMPDRFECVATGRTRQQAEAEKDELYKQIGQLKVELDFLKKRAGLVT